MSANLGDQVFSCRRHEYFRNSRHANVNDPVAPVGGNDLEPVDPPAAFSDEINGNDVTGCPGADDADNIGEALYLAVLVCPLTITTFNHGPASAPKEPP